MSQKIKKIPVKDLVLWTENPRDTINPDVTDQDIADRAIVSDKRSKWNLKNLFNKMGHRFDQSEIPTVTYIDGKPIVYDGNRRVLIGKIIHDYVKVNNFSEFSEFSRFDFPKEIPCNVCDEETALEHVYRKHSEDGSWKPLERDIFMNKHRKEQKSHFLVLEEKTNIISRNPLMNQRFVKDEIFKPTVLHKMGFAANNGELSSAYPNNDDALAILNQVVDLVNNKKITTRKHRGDILKLLDKRKLKKKTKIFKPFSNTNNDKTSPHKTRTTQRKQHDFFGEKLILKPGPVNNIYSDLCKLFKDKDKKGYSDDFGRVIRMGLRLLCELAKEDEDSDIKHYIERNFAIACKNLSQDERTTLNTQKIEQSSLQKLLHIGAHGYTAANNMEQTIAMSLIIGKMLSVSHGK